MRVSICIPTFRRPAGLARAVRSVLAQRGLGDMDAELVVIDNSPEGAAMPALRRLQDCATIPVRIAHERRAGVSFARNAALRLATGDLIAWLDDDQSASHLWLDRLVAAQRDLKADIVFGPVEASAPKGPNQSYFEGLYTRLGPKQDMLIAKPLGIGNCLMVRARVLNDLEPFDTRANETGGEDDRLFAQCQARNLAFAWAAGARVTEYVEPSRANLRHALRRAFAYGQGPCETAAARGENLGVARHMLTGAAQAMIFGVAYALAWCVRAPQRVLLLDRAARGAGKVLWFRQQKFYGAAA